MLSFCRLGDDLRPARVQPLKSRSRHHELVLNPQDIASSAGLMEHHGEDFCTTTRVSAWCFRVHARLMSRRALTEGRYLVFELNSYALSSSSGQLAASKALAEHTTMNRSASWRQRRIQAYQRRRQGNLSFGHIHNHRPGQWARLLRQDFERAIYCDQQDGQANDG